MISTLFVYVGRVTVKTYVLKGMSLEGQAEVISLAKVDADVLGEVMLANESLIWHSIKRYVGDINVICNKYSVEKDDLLQLGRVGFIKSIRAFDVHRGVRFSSFSVPAITREIRCFLRDNGSVIRPTRKASELLYRIHKIEDDLGYLPPLEEVADILDANLEQVIKAVRIGKTVHYLDVTISTDYDGAISFVDTINDDIDVEGEVLDEMYGGELDKLLKRILSTQEYKVLQYRLQGDMTKNQIASNLGISKMRVNRMLKKIGVIVENATGIAPRKNEGKSRKKRASKYEDHIEVVRKGFEVNDDLTTADIRDLLYRHGLTFDLPLSTLYHIKRNAQK